MSIDGSGEGLFNCDLSSATAVNTPIDIPPSKGQQITGFIVISGVPAGTNFKVFRKGTSDGPIFGNKGSLLGAWCANDDGLQYMYDVATPGGQVVLQWFTAPGGQGASYA